VTVRQGATEHSRELGMYIERNRRLGEPRKIDKRLFGGKLLEWGTEKRRALSMYTTEGGTGGPPLSWGRRPKK